jgi:hypothetical protein
VLLLIHFLLILHRAIARSSGTNYLAGDFPCGMLIVLIAFESWSHIRNWTGRATWNNRTVVALVISAGLSAWLPAFLSNPVALVRQLQSLSPEEMLRQSPADPRFAGQHHPHLPKSTVEVQRIRQLVEPQAPYWAVEDALANYIAERRNPTRHAIAFTICSPAEQRRAVHDLEHDPPQRVLFRSTLVDHIPPWLRYYVVSQYLFDHYQPSDTPPLLAPRQGDWQGFDRFPEEWGYKLPLGRLAARWGAERLPFLSPARARTLPVELSFEGVNPQAACPQQVWTCDLPIEPARFNYLTVRMPTGSAQSVAGPCDAVLEFASPGEDWDATNQVTWRVLPGDEVFLLPVGCSAGWAWRKSISRLRLTLPAQGHTAPRVELLWIDELAAP